MPWRADVVKEGFTVETKGRVVLRNRKPGLGIELDEDEIKKHPFQQEARWRLVNATHDL